MALASSLSSKPVPPCSRKVSTAEVEVHQNKLDFFCKLGYGKKDICKVLENLGQEALEDDVLKELIRMGSKPQALETQAQPSLLKLVARGSCSTSPGSKWFREDDSDSSDHLRPIVIDGSNVAMSHGNKEVFSCWGIQLAVDWFRERGHTYIKVFVPLWRKDPPRQDCPIADQHILEELEKQSILVYTPSRKVKGKRVVCYDDRYIVKVAYEKDGVIVSNDHYRDLQKENPEWKWFIEQRLLMYSFVSNRFMPPDDPLGRHGPTLNNFLSKNPVLPEPKWQPCPYGKKCTYGNKCKFYHPERPHQAQLSVADELRAKVRAPLILGGAVEQRDPTQRRAGGGEPAPPSTRTETPQEPTGLSCALEWSRGSCPEHPPGSWAGGLGAGLGLEQQLPQPLQPEPLPGQMLLEKMSALSIGDDTYGYDQPVHIPQDREVTGSPHHCGDLGHNPYSLHHPHSWDHSCLPGCPFQHLVLAGGRMGPEHSWPQERCGTHRLGQRSRCLPDGAQHERALETQHHVLPQSTALRPDLLHSYSKHQQQHPFPIQPPRQPFLLDSSNGLGFFQEAHAYPDASYSDYWPTPAARPPSAQQMNIHKHLCSLFSCSEVNYVTALYPDIKDIASLTLLIQRHRNL